jgi:phospholipid/cholesterol/gamma-HCH transport system substrate-binding protein
MLTRGIKIRLMAFLALSAVGIVYVTASYLGFVDKMLGRNLEMHVTLPQSSGLFSGSEVTNRGVKIGRISHMHVTQEGVELDLTLHQGTKIPLSSPVYVHNLSAVGEQYLDFEPTSQKGPYAEAGDTIKGDRSSLPVDEDDLLIQMNELVQSLDKHDLQTVVKETGLMFHDTGRPLQRMIDSGDTFIREAQAHQAETISLLDNGLTVLRTQQKEGDNIKSFARDLADVTGAVRASDSDLRTVIDQGGPAAREVEALMKQLEPTLPVMLANLVTVQQVVTVRLDALEQILVTFPRMIASGFSGTPGDGFGHINMQLGADAPMPCRKGYLPPNRWRKGNDLTDTRPYYAAHCASGPPINMRGTKYAPKYPAPGGKGYRVAPYDPRTGTVDSGSAGGNTAAPGSSVTIGGLGGERTLFGNDSWKWLLVGPVSGR